jgi:xanthine dehydrogenase accessory factor
MKIGDLDPRAQREHCFTISDKSLAVGGGALEAVLAVPLIRAILNARNAVEKT